MVKKNLVIGMMCVGIIALLQSQQAMGWSFKWPAGGGIGSPKYIVYYDITGGQQPGTTDTYVASELFVIDGALVSFNPGTNQLDVRQGKGGITLFAEKNLGDDAQYDERGRIHFTDDIACATVGYCNQIGEDFNTIWGITEKDYKKNWEPQEFLIISFNLYGEILVDCANGCKVADDITVYCETNEDPRALGWFDEGRDVRYICVDENDPVAWDDPDLSVQQDRTLKVRAPGVLKNDHDTGDGVTLITAELGTDVSNGQLTLNSDGSLTYTPNSNYLGEDTFTYRAKDEDGNYSNEAKVIISVYQR